MRTLTRKALTAGLICGLASGSVILNGAEVREYPCHRLPSAPVLDGKLDDEAWQALPEVTGFYTLNLGGRPGDRDYAVEKQTFFRAGWTDDSLYLAVKCVEPLMSEVRAGSSVWAGDSMELFFVPETNSRHYCQLATNSAGSRWNAIGPDIKKTPPWDWEVRPGKWDKGWLLEVRIPFSVLGGAPADGGQWPINIARNILTGPATERFTCWAPTPGAFNNIENFGLFVFKPGKQSGRAAREEGRKLNAPFYRYLRKQCLEMSSVAKDAPALRKALNNPSLAKEAAPLKALMAELARTAKRKNAAPGEMMALLDTYRNQMTVFSEKAETLNIPLGVVLPLTFAIKARDAGDVRLIVNGEVVQGQNDAWPVALREGLNIIGMAATANGKAPGLRLRIPGRPELARRWRVGVATDNDWLKEAFDDRTWRVAQTDEEGYLRWPKDSTGNACFRQIVLWGEKHYTGLPCIQPKVREWGFSENSMETLFHPLYSPPPLGFPLEDYEFVLDVPAGFSLLKQDYDGPFGGGRLNRRPQDVVTENVRHDDQPYIRYRFAFKSECVRPFESAKKIQMALIPLLLDKFKGAKNTCRFCFRRLASGNLTELEQQLPVRVLPPINGRMPKRVAIQQYCSVPWLIWAGDGGGRLFPEHFESHMRQSFAAGFNRWVIPASAGEFGRKVYDRVLDQGGVVAIWGTMNYPLWGNNAMGPDSAMAKFMLSTPQGRVRYWNDIQEWTINRRPCPTFATGQGAAQFKDAVKKDISLMLHGGTERCVGFPKATVYFLDWEQLPWPKHNVKHVFCFCENCKQAFSEYAKLPDTADLSDDSIKKNYRNEWSAFRHELDGRVNGIAREACNELGLKYMYYDMVAYKENWPCLKGKVDIAFPGLPGGDVCYGNRQAHVDGFAEFLRENGVGAPQMVGQQFASTYHVAHPWDSWTSRQEEFWNPKVLKLQILRIVAATHGGIDLNCSLECFAGMKYYIGEATRIINTHEDLFWDGERADELAASEQIKYPNLLVLKKGRERLVLLFNESAKPISVVLRNRDIASDQTAAVFETDVRPPDPETMKLTIPSEDVVIVHMR